MKTLHRYQRVPLDQATWNEDDEMDLWMQEQADERDDEVVKTPPPIPPRD